MSLFRNLNFISNISTQEGLSSFPTHIGSILQGLVQNQTRKLLQTSCKVMTQSHRQQLQVNDLETALNILDLKSIVLIPSEDKFQKLENGYLRMDKTYTDCQQFIKDQLKDINHTFDKPHIKGRWIFFNDKIPKIHQNVHIKNYTEILELQENQFKQRNKMFNIIKNKPLNVLSQQEQDFFKQATIKLEQGIVPSLDDTNPQRILQMFMWYINSTDLTDSTILLLFDILKNIQNKQKIEPNLNAILIHLVSYEGSYCYESGLEIGKLILFWHNKYPRVNQILLLMQSSRSYYCKIKLLAIETVLGVSFNISDEGLDNDLKNKVPMAKEFYYLIHKKYRLKEQMWKPARDDKVLEDTMSIEEDFQNITI